MPGKGKIIKRLKAAISKLHKTPAPAKSPRKVGNPNPAVSSFVSTQNAYNYLYAPQDYSMGNTQGLYAPVALYPGLPLYVSQAPTQPWTTSHYASARPNAARSPEHYDKLKKSTIAGGNQGAANEMLYDSVPRKVDQANWTSSQDATLQNQNRPPCIVQGYTSTPSPPYDNNPVQFDNAKQHYQGLKQNQNQKEKARYETLPLKPGNS